MNLPAWAQSAGLMFVPFALFYMKQPPKLDFLWAGLCLVGISLTA